MAEEEKKEGEEKEEKSSKKSKKTLFIIGGVLGVLLIMGIPLGYFLLRSGGEEGGEVQAEAAVSGAVKGLVMEGSLEEDQYEEGEEAIGAFYAFEPFVVNLAEGGYLRVEVQAEFKSREIPRRFYLRLIQIRDALIDLLSSYKREEISTRAQRIALKASIRESINKILKKDMVKKVYFTNFVIK
ncbi:MAG: hypothetical protein D6780_01305 [Candidatus Dadabacteria bacterium]|nr:MAG: hypothetical protein D6780_01305 [Candidatus Dadabacteria bacterium]